MAAAAPAKHFGPVHEEATVGAGEDRVREWPVEARPAGSAVELGRRIEQWKHAPRTRECAAAMLLIEGTREGALRAGFTKDVVAFGAE